jgi:hypothetical protein
MLIFILSQNNDMTLPKGYNVSKNTPRQKPDKIFLLFLLSGIAIWFVSVLGIEHPIYRMLLGFVGCFLMVIFCDGTKKFLTKGDQIGYVTSSCVIFGTLFFYVLTESWVRNIPSMGLFGIYGIAILHRLFDDIAIKRETAFLNSN